MQTVCRAPGGAVIGGPSPKHVVKAKGPHPSGMLPPLHGSPPQGAFLLVLTLLTHRRLHHGTAYKSTRVTRVTVIGVTACSDSESPSRCA